MATAHAVIASPVGFLALAEADDALLRIEFLGESGVLSLPATPLLRETAAQLAAYFSDPFFRFDLPVRVEGTDFRQKVWAGIAAIPCGEVITYAELARRIDSAPRAVGGACGANPLPLIIPCHRVVAAHGLGGFNARKDGVDWLPIKRWLLAHEQSPRH